MSKTRKTMAGFSGVAAPIQEPVKAEALPQQEEPVKDPVVEPEPKKDILDERVKRKKFTDTHTQRGLYIREDLDKILTQRAKKGGHGMKTLIVNEALERLFKEKGWMD